MRAAITAPTGFALKIIPTILYEIPLDSANYGKKGAIIDKAKQKLK